MYETFHLPTYRPFPFPDDCSPFSQHRGTSGSSKLLVANQRSVPATRGSHGVATTSRARATTLPVPRPLKPTARQVPSERAQAIRIDPTPPISPSKKSSDKAAPTRSATTTGCITSTPRMTTVSMTSRLPTRPATSISLRPPTITTKKVTMLAKFRSCSTLLVADSEFVLEFDGPDVADDDFMFDI